MSAICASLALRAQLEFSSSNGPEFGMQISRPNTLKDCSIEGLPISIEGSHDLIGLFGTMRINLLAAHNWPSRPAQSPTPASVVRRFLTFYLRPRTALPIIATRCLEAVDLIRAQRPPQVSAFAPVPVGHHGVRQPCNIGSRQRHEAACLALRRNLDVVDVIQLVAPDFGIGPDDDDTIGRGRHGEPRNIPYFRNARRTPARAKQQYLSTRIDRLYGRSLFLGKRSAREKAGQEDS